MFSFAGIIDTGDTVRVELISKIDNYRCTHVFAHGRRLDLLSLRSLNIGDVEWIVDIPLTIFRFGISCQLNLPIIKKNMKMSVAVKSYDMHQRGFLIELE